MAKIGLNNFRYAKLTETEDGGATYEAPKKPGKAVSCNVEIETSDARLYADDGLAEYDSGFQSGTVTLGLDELDIATEAELLGHTVDQQTNAITRNVDDVAPYVGIGRVIVKMVNSVRKYKVEFLCKVKFAEPSEEDETKGEELEFRTPELEGAVAQLGNGNWSHAAVFDTKAEAITYLEGLFTPATQTTPATPGTP